MNRFYEEPLLESHAAFCTPFRHKPDAVSTRPGAYGKNQTSDGCVVLYPDWDCAIYTILTSTWIVIQLESDTSYHHPRYQ